MMKYGNKSGFSLLEMIIAMGLAAGLLIFYMKMQGEQAKKTLTAKVNQEIETFTTDFKGTMARPGFCNKSFENTTLADNSETKIENIKNPLGDIRYAVDSKYGNNTLILKAITLKAFKPDDVDGLEGIATLQLNIEKIGNVYGSKSVFKTMELSVSRDNTKKIVACGSLSTGGINVQIVAPTIPARTQSANGSTSTNPNNSPIPTEQQAQSSEASQAASGGGGMPSEKAIMEEIEKNPELKRLHEAFKKSLENPEQMEDLSE